jgi:hypothetical protein
MLPDKTIKCPYTGFAKTCLSIVSKKQCPKWVNIIGKNPQTGQDINRFDCADALMPLLLIENAQMSKQTAAAVESFRNTMVALNSPRPMPLLGDNDGRLS